MNDVGTVGNTRPMSNSPVSIEEGFQGHGKAFCNLARVQIHLGFPYFSEEAHDRRDCHTHQMMHLHNS